MSDGKMIFCNKYSVQPFRTTIANANIGILKSLPTLFGTFLDHMPVKFEQNRLARNIHKFDKLFLAKF